MDKRSLILGGTKGLGLSLALASQKKGIPLTIVGRSFDVVEKTASLKGAPTLYLDLRLGGSNRGDLEKILSTQVDYFFWVAGRPLISPLQTQPFAEIQDVIDIHLTEPINLLARYLEARKTEARPLHLITIASSSSWRARENESVYCAVKAGQAHFTRNIARELVRDFPGSRTLLVNPGGMRTPNFWGSERDISSYMDPDLVASIIWDHVLGQEKPFLELHVLRGDDGQPVVEVGQKTPEAPF